MINKKTLSGFSFFLIIIIAIILIRPGSRYKVKLFESDSGWGYDILASRKPYIHQPFVPVVEGQVPFTDKKDARKTARLVIYKLRKHQSPALTKKEIESILK